MKRLLTHAEQRLIDHFQHDLDELETSWPMRNQFERIEPYIVDVNQVGLRFRFIIFHRESEIWYGRDRRPEGTPGDFDSFAELMHFKMPLAGDVVFDLGCNAGFWSTWFALAVGTSGMVHAFDPCPWNTLATRYQARLNYLDNLRTYGVGIGANRRTIRVPLTAAQTKEVEIVEGQRSGNFEIHSLREYAHLKPTFVKMDIEGAEMEVAPLLRDIPSLNALYLELHPIMIRERGGDPIAVLREIQRAGLEIVPDSAYNQPLSDDGLHETADAYYCVKADHFEACQKSLRSPNWNYFFQYIQYHLNRAELDKALEYARRGVELHPDITHLHMSLANILISKSDVVGALDAAELAMDLAPTDAHVIRHLSWVLAVACKTERSVELARRALAIDPSVATFWHHLSVQLNLLGHREEALSTIAEALRLDPHNENFRKHRQNLVGCVQLAQS